jgi:hypothetical protein
MEVRAELEKLGVDVRTVVADATVPASVLRSYVGEYRYADETAAVTLENGKLFIRTRHEKRELRPRSSTEFYAVDADREYAFQRKSGRVASVIVTLPDFTYTSLRLP